MKTKKKRKEYMKLFDIPNIKRQLSNGKYHSRPNHLGYQIV